MDSESRARDLYRNTLQQIRYRRGRVDGYASRLHYFTDWIRDNEQKGLVRELTADLGGVQDFEAIDFMTQAGIRHHLFLQGNHDDKMFRGSDGEQSFTEFLHSKVFPEISLEGVTVSATNRYYAIMRPRAPRPWPFSSPDNFPWIFTHQKNYGKNPLSVAGELGSIEFGNIVSGHQHHLSIGRHKSGLMYICDAGTLQDSDLPSYKNARQSRHPKWACGFLTVIDGVPQIHNHI